MRSDMSRADVSAGAAECDTILLKCCSHQNTPLCKMSLNNATYLLMAVLRPLSRECGMSGELLAGLHHCLAVGRSRAGLSRYCQPEDFVLYIINAAYNSSNRKAKP